MRTPWKLEGEKRFPKLESNMRADVAIIGGGLTGLWCARLLSNSGKKVVVLDKDRIGSGATEYTTAFLTQVVDTPLWEMEKMFGTETARLVWQAGEDALELIKSTIKEEEIECEFSLMPLHVFAHNGREYQELQREHRTARRLGFETVLKSRLMTGFKNSGAIALRDQAIFHPLKFLAGLRNLAEEGGVDFFENSEVLDAVGNSPAKVVTKDGFTIEADHVVVATYDPLGSYPDIRFKKAMYVSYCLELEIEKGRIRHGMYNDIRNPYHYFRVEPLGDNQDRMIIGGEDHREEISFAESKSFKALYKFVDKLLPDMKYQELSKWTGPILESSDGLALMGEISPRRYIATGFSGNGMTYAPLAAMIICDLIQGKDNQYAEVFDPKRKFAPKAILHKAIDYTGEFFGGAVRNLLR